MATLPLIQRQEHTLGTSLGYRLKNQVALEKLMKFHGYGNPKSHLWFLGIEERLPNRANERNELKVRASFQNVMDLNDALTRLGRKKETAKTQTWTWMSKFALALIYETKEFRDRSRVREYRNHSLGRKRGDIFLTELFPFPAPSSRHFPKRYGNRRKYEQAVLPERKRQLAQMLMQHAPRYVIAYGNKRLYRKLFTEFGVATWRRIDKFSEGGSFGSTKIVLTSFFRGFGHEALENAVRWLRTAS